MNGGSGGLLHNKMETKNKKTISRNRKIAFVLLTVLNLFFTFSLVSAYSTPLNVPTIWDTIVDQLFGSFYMAVLAITIVWFIILAIGGISLFTNFIYCLYFILAMLLGYGDLFWAAGIILLLTIYGITQTYKYWSQQ